MTSSGADAAQPGKGVVQLSSFPMPAIAHPPALAVTCQEKTTSEPLVPQQIHSCTWWA